MITLQFGKLHQYFDAEIAIALVNAIIFRYDVERLYVMKSRHSWITWQTFVRLEADRPTRVQDASINRHGLLFDTVFIATVSINYNDRDPFH